MRTFLLVLCASALGIASCVTIGTPTPVSLTPQFVTATLAATKTPYTSPTTTPTAATPSTPVATSDPNCKDAAVLLQDVTIADNTNVANGSKFTKTWQFKNTGSCNWHGYTIAFISGDRMGAPDTAPVDDTTAKSPVNISVDLTAPSTDGFYTGIFELRNSDGKPLAIGTEKSFWVKIAVGDVSPPTIPVASSPVPGSAVPVPTSAGTAAPAATGPASCKYVLSGSYPGEIIALINKARTGAGLSALNVSSQLATAAQGHSNDMACFSLLSHSGSNGSTPSQRIAAAGYSASYSEEMIYAGGYPQDAFDWWMGDPTHHDVIFDTRISDIGVGYTYVSDSAYGGYYTVDVASP
ncbi:MAG TPA: NBR1-Ig-like domain-containing protein [Anaerolineales bacterium]|nr:NBR1-Ig-like domain-containing protein [Anaerolineales bacterium]